MYLGISLVLSLPADAQELPIPRALTLSDAVRLAEARSPRVVAARQLVEMATADLTDASRRPNGALSLEGEAYPLFESPRPSFWDGQALTLRYDQEIETFGRRGLRMEVAEVGIAVASEEIQESRRRLRQEVGRAYFQLVLAQADRDVATVALGELERVIALTQARVNVGEVAGAELRRLQVERLRFVDDVLAAELAARNAQAALLGLMNVEDLSQPVEALDALAAPPLLAPDGRTIATASGVALDPAALREEALALRPGIRVAQLERTRAETETRRQRALRTPNITAGWGYRRHFGTNRMEFGITIPVPIFNSLNPGGVARAEAGRRRADALAQVEARAVEVELQQAVNAVDVSAERVRYIEQEYLLNAQESLDITRVSYELGAANLIDFLDAQRAFRETQQVRNQALYALRVSLIELASAVGLPLSNPSAPVG